MKSILLLSRNQYGYQVDYYNYAKYLGKENKVTVVCIDSKRERINATKNVKVIYTTRSGYRLFRAIHYLILSLYEICFGGYDSIIISYYPNCSYLVLINKNMILDIRTLSVNKDFKYRNKYNAKLVLECNKFNKINVVSNEVKQYIEKKMNKKCDINVVGLGGESFKTKRKKMNSINLLYVGTLTGRDIYKAVEFIHEFIMQSGADVKFNIIGDGEDYDKIEHYVNKHSIHNRIILHGYVKQTELYKYYEISNVGLAYVPITDFYRFQPATKVYEYLASGLFVIASNYTSFDGLIKHKINGYIIDNSKESVFDAINFILNNLDYLNISKDIETKYYSWENVIYTQLYKTLNI